jgi:hypothetical protein
MICGFLLGVCLVLVVRSTTTPAARACALIGLCVGLTFVAIAVQHASDAYTVIKRGNVWVVIEHR